MEQTPASSMNADSEQPTQPAAEVEQKQEPQSQQPQAEAPTPQPEPAQEEQKTTYLKAMPLRDLADLESVKAEVQNGNIVILKITLLANKNILDVSKAVNELHAFTESINGDIARLGEERIVICPPKIRIWREKKPAQNEPLPTAA